MIKLTHDHKKNPDFQEFKPEEAHYLLKISKAWRPYSEEDKEALDDYEKKLNGTNKDRDIRHPRKAKGSRKDQKSKGSGG